MNAKIRFPQTACALICVAFLQQHLFAAAMGAYTLEVEIIQVCDDNGANCAPLDATNDADHGYVYETQINDIWAQAGVSINFSYSTWNETDALELTQTEMNDVFANNTTAFPTLPAVGTDTLQFFFVDQHPGTTSWPGNPIQPANQARNAGITQLYIDTVFSSNGRGVMANEGFESDQLAGTLAHEIGHAIGLRHVNAAANDTMVNGWNVDPTVTLAMTEENLMWSAGSGPAYDNMMTLAENFPINCDQIMAAIHNGGALDPDGNGIGVLVPEPSSFVLLYAGVLLGLAVRRRR